MAITQQQRQAQLFAAETWQTLYQGFVGQNFSSYDFSTIRASMIDYIRLNYPEDFNDWIESSELVAIIDLLSYLGQSLAFRMDLNTRENFLDTAQRRSSIFRLARMLSYQPQRCIPAQGLLKISQVVSNQPIYDANGLNLQNTPILWNDPNNPDWYEQFILVLNAAFDSSNPFGNPSVNGTVLGVPTELYPINSVSNPSGVIGYSTTVGGNSMNFELINPNFTSSNTTTIDAGSSGYFYELPPNPLNSWNIVYRNDGQGYSSADTGFFVAFKQGSLNYSDYSLTLALANRVIDVNADGINQTDVFVQTIDNTGLVVTDWTAVPSVNGFNVIYNSLNNSQRNIYSVITRDNSGSDQISIRFADGNFGNVPVGIIRVWYRISNGLNYIIRPSDMSGISFTMNYEDNLNNTYGIAFTADLQTTVSNAQSSETINQIKLNASQVYYTQDRMVNGEDYNIFPLQSSAAIKTRSVNRTYSGHSRYIDINDPTGGLQNINVFSDDGIFYSESDLNSVNYSVNAVTSAINIINNAIQPLISGTGSNSLSVIELRDFFYANWPTYDASDLTWLSVSATAGGGSTGALMSGGISGNAVALGAYGLADEYKAVTVGSLLEFNDGSFGAVTGVVSSGTGVNQSGILNTGIGAVSIDQTIANNTTLKTIYAAWNTTFDSAAISSITAALNSRKSFGIGYNAIGNTWYVISNDNLNSSGTFSLTYARDASNGNLDASWLILMQYSTSSWNISSRAQRYIFESEKDTRFYYVNTDKTVDITTGQTQWDTLNILGVNALPDVVTPSTKGPIGQNISWRVVGQETYPDGFVEPSAVRVTFWDQTDSGVPDDPTSYITVVRPGSTPNKLLFWQQYITPDGYQYYQPQTIAQNRIYATANLVPSSSDPSWTQGEFSYVISTGVVWQWTNGVLVDVTSEFKIRTGRNKLIYQWIHWAPQDQRINPSPTNIIDTYVLTSSYDTSIRNWIANGSSGTEPTPPTPAELRSTFEYLESYKMISDSIIWHPVSYKLLFGAQADPSLQVVFKVVKIAGTTVSDNEIRSQVIAAVNNYFALSNWDFGQSFFFTELSAYIHVTMATLISSVVITPVNPQSAFGDLFEISCDPNEIFLSCARVSDVQIVTGLTENNLGIVHA